MKNLNDMKKLFLILIMTATVATAWAQSQISTVRGKTKDGKTIKVDYYKGNVEDVIQSVKYQVVDELQADKAKLQAEKKTLEDKLKNCADPAEIQRLKKQVTEKDNKIKKLEKELEDCKKPTPNPSKDDCTELQQQIDELDATVKSLSKRVTSLNTEVSQLKEDTASLNKQLAECRKNVDCGKQIEELQQQVKDKNARISQLEAQIKDKESAINRLNKELADCKKGVAAPTKTPVIGLEVGVGPAFPGSSIAEPWAKEVKSCLQADVYFGSARLSESFPVSVEVGLGFRKFGMAARLNEYNTTLDAVDADGDSYKAIYAFDGLEESLSLTYFDIPIRLCFGQPAKERVTAYAKLGLTPSIKLGSTFEGTGKYSLKGYYPQWDVTLENVAPLDFGSDMDCYEGVEPELKGFNLWGNVAFGAYVPIKGSYVVINAGVKLDYPIMGIGTINTTNTLPDGKAGLLQNGGKVVIPSVEVGLIYTLK